MAVKRNSKSIPAPLPITPKPIIPKLNLMKRIGALSSKILIYYNILK
jgi:hypothetical protein